LYIGDNPNFGYRGLEIILDDPKGRDGYDTEIRLYVGSQDDIERKESELIRTEQQITGVYIQGKIVNKQTGKAAYLVINVSDEKLEMAFDILRSQFVDDYIHEVVSDHSTKAGLSIIANGDYVNKGRLNRLKNKTFGLCERISQSGLRKAIKPEKINIEFQPDY